MKTILIIFLGVMMLGSSLKADFLTDQKKYERVRTAVSEKEAIVKGKLEAQGIKLKDLNIMITVFKHEKRLDIYAKNKSDVKYKKIISYDICQSSGEPGPKRKQGDGQVPEGFYFIDRFNPVSNFYLSLGINYPNDSDKKIGTGDLGGDIFVHGNCVTIGCVPMTDDKIKEIYLYAVHAKNSGQEKIPVYMFPFEMTDVNMAKFREEYKADPVLLKFWDNLKEGYDKFVKNKRELKVSVDNKSKYIFN